MKQSLYPLISPKYYVSLIRDLINFIKHPKYNVLIQKNLKTKIYDTVGLFIIKVVFSISIASIVQLVYEPENLTSSSMTERFEPLVFLLVGGIILPFFEEITFRLSLKFNPIYFAITSGAFIYYILTKAIFESRLSLVDDTFYYRLLIALVVVLVVYFIARRKGVSLILKQFWERNFRMIYYFSCISFAWLHIFNFELNLTNLLWLPIITLPQLFSATIAGYTRVAFGFQYPLLIHMSTNLFFISLMFLPFD